MTIYIAGKMTGMPDKGRAMFSREAERLRKAGHIVLNPAELPDGMPGTSYMPICLAMVGVADAVYALDNWTESKGATIEVRYAIYQGKEILHEGDYRP